MIDRDVCEPVDCVRMCFLMVWKDMTQHHLGCIFTFFPLHLEKKATLGNQRQSRNCKISSKFDERQLSAGAWDSLVGLSSAQNLLKINAPLQQYAKPRFWILSNPSWRCCSSWNVEIFHCSTSPHPIPFSFVKKELKNFNRC
jgi:hypothetical protein